MGTAESSGSERAKIAIKSALDSPLLNDRDIKGAKRILVTLATSKKYEATMKEQREIWRFVLSQVGGEARMFKLGTITDDSLGEKLRVTIVAAGFDSIESPIPGISLKSATMETNVVEEGVVDEGTFMVAREMDLTPTSSIDISHEPNLIPMSGSNLNISHFDTEPQGLWDNEETARISTMIQAFREGVIQYKDLDGPAFKRSHLDLWKRPAIPANEMEQHLLK